MPAHLPRHWPAQTGRKTLAGLNRALLRGEEGALFILGLMLFMMMIMIGSFGLELSRYDYVRTARQNTADFSVLAATDLRRAALPSSDANSDPKKVVQDYFTKAGLRVPSLSEITVTQGAKLEWRRVAVASPVQVSPILKPFNRMQPLTVAGAATGEQALGELEISLVLDVSGSMDLYSYDAWGYATDTKINLLKDAAKSFVDQVFTGPETVGAEPDHVIMSIVPYSYQVALGPDLAQDFTFADSYPTATLPANTETSCADFYAGDYTSTALPTTLSRSRPIDGFTNNSTYFTATSNWPVAADYMSCQNRSANYVLPWSNSKAGLKAAIGALSPKGSTSIEIGMKWGMNLIDPSVRSTLAKRITRVGATMSWLDGRPKDFDAPYNTKVIVLMTDGEPTEHFAVKAPYRSGPSVVYEALSGTNKGKFAIYNAALGTSPFRMFVTDAYGSPNTMKALTVTGFGGTGATITDTTRFRRLDWSEVFARYNIQRFVTLYYSYFGSGSLGAMQETVSATDKATRLSQICSAAKAKGVVVFTIAFEASTTGQNLLRSCASSDSRFFISTGDSLAADFSTIAQNIAKLKLVQ